MRVLLISSNKKWRGSEQVIDSLFNSNTAFEYYLYCAENAALYEKNREQINRIFIFKKNWIFILNAAYQLKKICTDNKINLIHLNDSHSINIYITASFIGLKVDAVLHRHVNLPITNTRKYNFSKIKKIICVSNEVKKTASKTISEEKLTLIYPGISIVQNTQLKEESGNYLKQLFKLPFHSKIIGNISAVAKEKNIIEFIQIANRCIENNKDYHFVIIGDGSLYESYKKDYSSTNIHFTGFISDIYSVLPLIDVFLFTSKNEGYPLVLLEAMAAKVPVITNYFPSVEEIIKQEETGFIYKDMQDAITKIELLIKDETIRNKIGTNAINFVQQFDISLMNTKIEEVYKSIFNNE